MVGVDIRVSGIKERGTLIWDLRDELERGKLLLEHAVAGKLIRPNFLDKTDGYDVAVSMFFVNTKLLSQILVKILEANPELVERVKKNIETTREYARKHFPREEVGIIKRVIDRLLNDIRQQNRMLYMFLRKA